MSSTFLSWAIIFSPKLFVRNSVPLITNSRSSTDLQKGFSVIHQYHVVLPLPLRLFNPVNSQCCNTLWPNMWNHFQGRRKTFVKMKRQIRLYPHLERVCGRLEVVLAVWIQLVLAIKKRRTRHITYKCWNIRRKFGRMEYICEYMELRCIEKVLLLNWKVLGFSFVFNHRWNYRAAFCTLD